METLLKISPTVIEFPIHLHTSISTTLRLQNISSSPVAFKIKTTAPKNYLVRPSTGIIVQDKSQDVQIILQPLAYEPSLPSTDRFLVQATQTDHETTNLTREFWTTLRREEMSDQRLNVAFIKKDSNLGGNGLSNSESNVAASGSSPAAFGSRFGYGGDPNASRVAAMAAHLPTDLGELKSQHEELIRLYQNAEAEYVRQQKEMQKDMEGLRQRLGQSVPQNGDGSVAAGGKVEGQEGGSTGGSGFFPLFEVWHWIPIVIAFFLALKFLGFI